MYIYIFLQVLSNRIVCIQIRNDMEKYVTRVDITYSVITGDYMAVNV